MSKEFDFGSLKPTPTPTPPRAPPKPIKKEQLKPPTKKIAQDQEEFFIDFNKIANNSSFQRFIVEAIKMCVPQLKGVSARTSKEVMNKDFTNKINEIDTAIKLKQEIKSLPSELLKELKTQLSKENYGLIETPKN